MATDQNKYQTKVPPPPISLKIGKISEAVWNWLNTTWPYIPQVSMCAIISATLHITLFVTAITYVATVIVTMMPLPCQCKQCFLSEVQLLAQVDYNKPCGWWILTWHAQKLLFGRFSYLAQLSLIYNYYIDQELLPDKAQKLCTFLQILICGTKITYTMTFGEWWNVDCTVHRDKHGCYHHFTI